MRARFRKQLLEEHLRAQWAGEPHIAELIIDDDAFPVLCAKMDPDSNRDEQGVLAAWEDLVANLGDSDWDFVEQADNPAAFLASKVF